MTFLHPEFLYMMLPPVLILFFFILTQKAPTEQLFDSEVFARLQVREKRFSLRQRNGIYLAVFILLITAMAQPVVIEKSVEVKAPEHEVMAVLDISVSMRTDDLYPSRLAVAKAKLQEVIARARTERIGVLAFGKDVYAVSPPTDDRAVLSQMIGRFDPDVYAEKGTDFMALFQAAESVMAELPHRDLLLFTDGGDAGKSSGAAAYAREHRIRLFILGTGTEEGAPLMLGGKPVMQHGMPVVTALNPELPELAAATGGYYVQATAGGKDVEALLAALRKDAPGGENGTKVIERYGQLFILPLGLALFLLLVAISSMSRRERVAVPPALLFCLLLSGGEPLQAGAFDYELLEEANGLYGDGEYRRAANAYYRYAKHQGDDPEALYDSAHAYYRAGDYTAAAAIWKGIRTKDRLLQFKTEYNLGNAYAMLGGEEHLQAAVKAYRQALYLQDDLQTRENMQIVLRRLMRLMQEKRSTTEGGGAKQGDEKAASVPAPTQGTGEGEKMPAKAEKAAPKKADTSGKTDQAQTMSDFETAVWMQRLQQQTQPHLYKITPESAKGEDNVNPW